MPALQEFRRLDRRLAGGPARRRRFRAGTRGLFRVQPPACEGTPGTATTRRPDANHQRLFRAIQDRNRQFNSGAAIADFVDGYGVDRDTFLRTFASARVGREVAAGERDFVSLGLVGVPALVVDDKYIINMDLGRKQALTVTGDLVQELLANRAKATPIQ